MKSSEVRNRYLKFFESRGHKIVPSSSLVPENDPTTLFTGSGMQPMIPYLLGEPHPLGVRLVDSQKAFRSQDIEEIGDNRHTTFFEMLGNWSLGDYWKKEQLTWLFEFLTSSDEGLGLDPHKLYISAFEGNDQVPEDSESIAIWQELFESVGIKAKIGERIFLYGVEKNWWSRSGTPEAMPVGEPGGPDSEVFYEFDSVEHDARFGKVCHPNCDCGRFLEIANSVFMQYRKTESGAFEHLPQKNVDFGGGLERLTAATNNEPDIFKNDLHSPIIEKLESELGVQYESEEKVTQTLRVIADHIKAAVFLIDAGVLPSNKGQGYVLRRLLRRSAVKIGQLESESMGKIVDLIDQVFEIYKDTDLLDQSSKDVIKGAIKEEIGKFQNTLEKGLREIEKIQTIDGKIAFDLYQTYGFPLEITTELFEEKGQQIDKKQFEDEFIHHQELSRTTSAGQFKGGLADQSEITTRLHTANHLLQAALREILGEHVGQRGSNITAERLRFDFSHPAKLTPEEIEKTENLVNQKISEDLPVSFEVEDKDAAVKSGALSNFGETYPDKVKVYSMGDPSAGSGQVFSKELCGGPHVASTSEVGKFKIIKEESAGSGIRRIYAIID